MALERIEAAVARLEAVARRPGPESLPAASPDLAPQLAELEATNARLRQALADSLQQIDALIARQGAPALP